MAKKDRPSYRPSFIRQWRQDSGMTLEELAPRVGVTFATLSRIETGKPPYSQIHLEKLAEIFGCEPVDLLTKNPANPAASAETLASALGALLKAYAPEKAFPDQVQHALVAALLGEPYTPKPPALSDAQPARPSRSGLPKRSQ